jgi:hypothetical protein
MKVISHRGNLEGRQNSLENRPEYIKEALSTGFDTEIDVWYVNNNFYLGHDNPTYKTDLIFLKTKGLWCHAKNLEAFITLKENKIHTFWHETDKVTLTSRGIPWCFIGIYIPKGITVCLNPELTLPDYIKGICTDYPLLYSKNKL